MCQHMVEGAPLGWMAAVRHAFLIRPPEEVAASFRDKWEAMRVEDLGFARQAELYDHVRALTGTVPPVIEARDVLVDPEGMLRALCAALGVAFDQTMLAWQPGRRPTDGVWAAHWYAAVERSTGFAPPRPTRPPPEALRPVVDACRPHYERLAAAKLGPAR
jgi:Sulfotransferase domain